jgi:RNA polymerase sigma-70 factor (ECF subfamily)
VKNSVAFVDEEQKLIALAQQGDRQAFCELVLSHHYGVVDIVYRMCGDPHLAEDSAQEAFLRAWQNIRQYRPRASFRSWVYRIATNVALDTLRRQKPSVDIDQLPITGLAQNLQTVAETREQADIVQQAVLALPPSSRTVLVLREYQGLSYKEISEALQIPLGTVMSRLSYARKQLLRTLVPIMENSS